MRRFSLHTAWILATAGALITFMEMTFSIITGDIVDNIAFGLPFIACLWVAWWSGKRLKEART